MLWLGSGSQITIPFSQVASSTIRLRAIGYDNAGDTAPNCTATNSSNREDAKPVCITCHRAGNLYPHDERRKPMLNITQRRSVAKTALAVRDRIDMLGILPASPTG